MITNQDTCDIGQNRTRKTGDPGAWRTQNQLSSGHSFDVLSTYETEDSLGEAISQCDSSMSTRSEMARLCQYRRLWYYQASLVANCRLTLAVAKTGKETCIGPYGSLSYIGHHPARTLSATGFRGLPPLKRRRAVDRDVYGSFFKGPSEVGNGQEFAMYKSSVFEARSCSSCTISKQKLSNHGSGSLSPVDFAVSFHSIVGKNRDNGSMDCSIALPAPLELMKKGPRSPTNYQYIVDDAESISIHDLESRLNRLQYELSPGFRGPKSVFCVSWAIDAPMFNPNFQVQLRSWKASVGSTGDTPTPGARNSTMTQKEYIKIVNLFDWRTAVNATRTRTGCENISCQPHIPIFEEEEFDTAAWILRRPPQGSESDFGPPIG